MTGDETMRAGDEDLLSRYIDHPCLPVTAVNGSERQTTAENGRQRQTTADNGRERQ